MSGVAKAERELTESAADYCERKAETDRLLGALWLLHHDPDVHTTSEAIERMRRGWPSTVPSPRVPRSQYRR